MAILEGIAALKGALDVSKTAIDLLRRPNIDGQQVREKLIELQDLVFSAQQALGTAQDDERELKTRIAELERYADFGKDFTLHHGVYWYEGYPYCPICWDVDRKPARLGGPLKNLVPPYLPLWSCSFHKISFAANRKAKA